MPVATTSIGASEPGDLASANGGLYFWLKVAAIIGAMYFMAGWSFGGHGFTAFAIFLFGFNYIARTWDEEGLGARAYLLAVIAASSATAVALWWGRDEQLDSTDMTMSLLMGIIIADGISSSRANARLQRAGESLLHIISEPVLFDQTGQNDFVQFEPRWGFNDREGHGVWAIDPTQRAVRRLRPQSEGDDRLFRWDVPIRSVELNRIRSFHLGERDIHVRSGHDKATERLHIFHFSSADRALALRWRDTFEAWMRDDQRTTKGSAR